MADLVGLDFAIMKLPQGKPMPIDTILASRFHQGQKIHHAEFGPVKGKNSVRAVPLKGGSLVADLVGLDFAIL